MITIKEIAQICDCSVATVSRALHGKPDVKPATMAKIQRIARENGYRPHRLAKSLVKGYTNTIGLVVLDIQNPFFVQLVSLFHGALLQKSYSLHLGIMDGTPESEYKVLDDLASMKVDGIIHFPLNTGTKYIHYLKQLRIPLVHLCNWLDDEFSFVGVDEQNAMAQAVAYVRDAGYQNIIYVSPPLRFRGSRNLYTLEERLAGVYKAAGTIRVLENETYIRDCRKIITESPARHCVVCSSDIFALDILRNLRTAGLQPPGDYGLMGFDNISILRYVHPRPATIGYPLAELVQKALEQMLWLLDNGSRKQCILKARLVPGTTV